MKLAGNIGGRHYYRIMGPVGITAGQEAIMLFPVFVPPVFYVGGIIHAGQIATAAHNTVLLKNASFLRGHQYCQLQGIHLLAILEHPHIAPGDVVDDHHLTLHPTVFKLYVV